MNGTKPLELTVYPKLERPMTGAEIMPYREQWKRENDLRQAKRLTGAELAAEAYRQNVRAIGECGDASIIRDGNEYRVVPSDVMTFGPMRREVWQSHTLIRFATLPHYDEAAQ